MYYEIYYIEFLETIDMVGNFKQFAYIIPIA